MNTKAAIFLVLCILGSMAMPMSSWKLKRNLGVVQEEAIPYNWFRQPLDHFTPSNPATWLQKYLVNNEYWGGAGSPIFILLGGEGPMGNSSVTGHFVVNTYAKEFKAMIVSVEHRFYGESMPLKDLSTANLVYLTSQQAISDYANFARYLKKQNPGSKVVTFGGSYSGALSAWIRYKYPDAVDIAIASSGPVNAQLDFPQYLEVVANSLETTGKACNEAIVKATHYYTELLRTDVGRRQIEKDFVTCGPIKTELDVVTFLEFLADTVAGFVQYNNDNSNYFPYNMNKMCDILTNGPVEKTFPAFVKSYNNFTQTNCSDVSYDDVMSQLENVDPKAPTAAGRSWTWQTCNEFGYYQTGQGRQPFSKQITLQYFVRQCQQAFGKTYGDLERAISKTNAYYHARAIRDKTTRTFFLNGSIDPWHALGIITNSNSISVPVFFIHGTAHCADLYPPRASDVPELTEARTKVVSFLKYWLTQN